MTPDDNCGGDGDFCSTCGNTGVIITCWDDLCAGGEYCIHGDGEELCPDCKEDTPHAGDISLCVYCGEIFVFQEDLTLSFFSPEDFSLLPHKTREAIRHAHAAILSLNNQRGAR